MQRESSKENTQTALLHRITLQKNRTFPYAMMLDAKDFTVETSPNRTSVNINASCIIAESNLLTTKRNINIGNISFSGKGVIENVGSTQDENSITVITQTTKVINKITETLHR